MGGFERHEAVEAAVELGLVGFEGAVGEIAFGSIWSEFSKMKYDIDDKNDDIRYCKSLLTEILLIWPKLNRSEPEKFRIILNSRLTSDFDESEFLNRLIGIGAWEDSQYAQDRDEVVLRFVDTGGYPQRAIFKRECGYDWLLKSLAFLCPVCFGTGEYNDIICEFCNGVGWG
jgi:hypothetical protein